MKRSHAAMVEAGLMATACTETRCRLGAGITNILDNAPQTGKRISRKLGLSKDYQANNKIYSDSSLDILLLCTTNFLNRLPVKGASKAGRQEIYEKYLVNPAVKVQYPPDLIMIKSWEGEYHLCHKI